MSTPNMGLSLPVDHGSADIWDVVLEAVFSLLDAHDHSTGKGVLVPSAGIGINADLSFAGFAVTLAKGFSFTEQAAASVTAYSNLLFVNSSDHNLYFRNASGSNVQITSGNTLNVSIVGGIGGDYSSVSALLSFDDATKRYLLQSEGSPRPWSGLATADIDLYEKAASIANKVTLKSPSALASSYSVTMPAALPAVSRTLWMGTGGVLATSSPQFTSAISFRSTSSDSNVTVASRTITTTNASNLWESPSHSAWGLRAGDRILQLLVVYPTAPAGTYSIVLSKVDRSGGGTTVQTFTTVNPTAGNVITYTVTSPTQIVAGERWTALFQNLPNAVVLGSIEAVWDRP